MVLEVIYGTFYQVLQCIPRIFFYGYENTKNSHGFESGEYDGSISTPLKEQTISRISKSAVFSLVHLTFLPQIFSYTSIDSALYSQNAPGIYKKLGYNNKYSKAMFVTNMQCNGISFLILGRNYYFDRFFPNFKNINHGKGNRFVNY